MATYTIEPERKTLHGAFSRDLEPVLTIESGDTVRFRTLDARWGFEQFPPGTLTRRAFEPRDPESDRGHALCGPVAIQGARPDMTLEVRVGELRTGGWGWNRAGGFSSKVNDGLNMVADELYLRWTLDDDSGVARSELGHTIRMNPHLGLMGMPPAEPGWHPTAPPRVTGGNIDCKHLGTGATLYLPIAVEGGLFSTGDGHGAMADGEVSGTGIECPMDIAELTFVLHEDMRLTTPRANTAAGWMTFGFDEDLDKAMLAALDDMLALMGEQHGMSRHEALALASLVVDLHVTQVANGVCGVHARLPHGAIG